MRVPQVLRQTVAELGAELRGLRPRGPRAFAALRAVAAVAIAVLAAHVLGLRDAWWSGISAFVVLQADFDTSFYRGVLRILGTALGALLGYLLGLGLGLHPVLFTLVVTGITWGGLHAALTQRHGYAWVLGVATFIMVMCDALQAPGQLAEFAVDRLLNVGLGTLACVLVVAATQGRVRASAARSRMSTVAAPAMTQDHRAAALHALHGAVAVALLGVFAIMYPLGALPQAMVTTIAVLVVPPNPQARAAGGPVMQRMTQRFAGCLLAGAMAALLLPLIEARAFWCQLALAGGVWIGAYLQQGQGGVRYVATQFSVAFIMVFVQDRGWAVQEAAALQRLAGVLVGIAALALIVNVVGRLAAVWPRASR
ncbi:MAG: FUSC family protein [Variovorax sp.]|nr:MAG: FUSC family protein [Variovorax sp.]